jgi:large subunit ribosomal protein L29
MKAEDLKGKTPDELKKALMDARKDQFNARMQRAAGQLENTTSLRAKRRDIARLKTAMNSKKPVENTAKKKKA